MRALSATGNVAQLRRALDEARIADGEYYVLRAGVARGQGRHRQSLRFLDTAETLPRLLLEYEQYKRESGYCRARNMTALFDEQPGEDTYRAALDAWYALRVTLRGEPNHSYHNVLQQETQRIGLKRREISGGTG